MSGLLVAGLELEVPGVRVINSRDAAWCKLDGGDYRKRRTPWVRQIIVHTTKGKWPQHVKPGAGPDGRDRVVADFWHKDPLHSAAHIVIDSDGSVACLADLAAVCAYHATTSNDWSVGIEIYQEADGGIYEAALVALEKLVPFVCETMSIPFQIAGDRYVGGRILERMKHGGPDCVGIFGHRDQAWDFENNTSARGRGDPGDEAYERLIAAGAEPMCFAGRGDLGAWKHRQLRLNLWGEKLTVDGICGPSTYRAMQRRGFAHGREIDAAAEAPNP